MTSEQEVKKVYPRAVCSHRPYLPSTARQIFNPPIDLTYLESGNGDSLSGVFDNDDDAWSDALRRIKEGGKA